MVSSINNSSHNYSLDEPPIIDRVKVTTGDSKPTGEVKGTTGSQQVTAVDVIEDSSGTAEAGRPQSALAAAFKNSSANLTGSKVSFWDKFLDTLKEIFTLSIARTRTYDGVIPDSGIWRGKAAKIVALHGQDIFSEFVGSDKKEVVAALKKEIAACNPSFSKKEVDNIAALLYQKMAEGLVDQYQTGYVSDLLDDPDYNDGDIALFTQLAATPYFNDMGPDEALSLVDLISSKDPFIGEPARQSLAKLLFSPDFADGDYDAQATLLNRFVQNYPENEVNFSGLSSLYDEKRIPVEISAPENIGAGRQYSVSIYGREVRVILPENGGAGVTGIDEIAKAVGTLPKAALLQLATIEVKDAGTAGEPYGAESRGDTIVIYPQEDRTQGDLDLLLNHHAGRLVAEAKYSDDDLNLNWNNYRTVMRQDIFGLSSVSKKDVMSDIGEAFALYQAVRGTAYEETFTRLFMGRYSQIIGFIAKGERQL